MMGSKGLEGSRATPDRLGDGLVLHLSRGEAGLVRLDRPMEPVHPRVVMLKPYRHWTVVANDADREQKEVQKCGLAIQRQQDGTLHV